MNIASEEPAGGVTLEHGEGADPWLGALLVNLLIIRASGSA